MVVRKRPEGEEFGKFCWKWDKADHENKIRLCADYGVTYDTAKHWRSESGVPKPTKRASPKIEHPQQVHQSMSAGNELSLDTGKDFKTAMVINDTQNPYQDLKAMELVHNFMKELQPDYLIRNGDMADMYQISSFDQDPRRKTRLAEDIQNSKDMARIERELVPNARIIDVVGNHELRWQKFLWSRAPELVDLDCLKFEELFGLNELGIELVDFECGIMVNELFMFIHGNLASVHSSYTAKRMFEKHGGCGMCAHTHRGGVYYKRNRFGVWGWWENFCESPDDLILLSDLTWKKIGDITVGTKIVGFDENPVDGKMRRLRNGEVTKHELVKLPAKKIYFADGRTVISSYDHRWLRADSQGMWVKTSNLRVGYKIRQLCEPWDSLSDRDSGYLAGVFDGEGWCDGFNQGRPSIRLGFAQNDNELNTETERILLAKGFEFSRRTMGNSFFHRLLGGSGKSLEFLGSVRPLRLLSKLKLDGLAMNIKNNNEEIVAIEDVGIQELVNIETTTSTYFGNGFASHNCLCSLYPDWIANPDWVQGFSLVHFKGQRFFVEQIPILGHSFIYGGKTYG